jgi:hypothetical protein
MTSATVWVESSELWVADAARVIWHGRPGGQSVKFAVAVREPASDDEWIAVRLEDGLVARTSNSWIVGLHLNTGATRLRTFNEVA